MTVKNYYASTNDGEVSNAGEDTWSNIRNGITGDRWLNNRTVIDIWIYGDGSWYELGRGFLDFDTSDIPENAIIISADLYLYSPQSNEIKPICAMKGIQAIPMSTDDYNSFAGSSYGTVILIHDQYNIINFNAQGKLDIVKGGITKICVRDYDYDYTDLEPDGLYYMSVFRSASYEGTDYDPYLAITYEIPLQAPILTAIQVGSEIHLDWSGE